MILEILRYNRDDFMRLLMNLSRNLFEILRYYFAIDGMKILWKIFGGKVSDFMGVRVLTWFKCTIYVRDSLVCSYRSKLFRPLLLRFLI